MKKVFLSVFLIAFNVMMGCGQKQENQRKDNTESQAGVKSQLEELYAQKEKNGLSFSSTAELKNLGNSAAANVVKQFGFKGYRCNIYNATTYFEQNKDVVNHCNYTNQTQQECLFKHWLDYGIAEGRNAGKSFRVKSYLKKNPDVDKVVTGYALSALIAKEPTALSLCGNSVHVMGSTGCRHYLATLHFLKHGCSEGRIY